jgi:hypothetical protein
MAWPRVITVHVVDGALTALHNLTRGGIEIPVILAAGRQGSTGAEKIGVFIGLGGYPYSPFAGDRRWS